MKITSSIIMLLLIISGCNPDKKEVSLDLTGVTTKVEHEFSKKGKQDIFEVKLTGSKPASMLLDFSITSFEGTKIYVIQIKGTDLLGSTDPNIDLTRESDQIAFIQNIAKEFLNKENFLVPAVTQDQTADDYTPDKAFHNELKISGLNGFTYRLGKENNFYIAWSQKEGKVKAYYNCC